MMHIRYFFRHKSVGFSIQRVFHTLITELQQHTTLDTCVTPSARSMPWDILRNSNFTYKHRNKKGINHITGHIHEVILGLVGCKTVLTIHDLAFLKNVHNPVKRFYKWFFWLYLPVKMANKVTCISAYTRTQLLRYIKTDKSQVIHNPLDPIYKYTPKTFNKDKPMILHIGTGWNKNLQRTIAALQDIPCHLRILGKIDKQTWEQLSQARIEYSSTFNLTDEEVRLEYINCDIVSFPSTYEGFGMPIIEGQATGRAVLTSRIDPLVEVSGNAVHYVSPDDTTSLRAGFQKLINDESYREQLIRSGLENIHRFRVEKIAKQYLDVYKEVMTYG